MSWSLAFRLPVFVFACVEGALGVPVLYARVNAEVGMRYPLCAPANFFACQYAIQLVHQCPELVGVKLLAGLFGNILPLITRGHG
jgi:hypothetical protein